VNVRQLIFIAIGVLLVSLILHLPASLASRWLGSNARVAMAGVDGTVWSGGASSASVGSMHLGQLRWQFRPFSLFRGRLDYRLDVSGPTLNFQGRVGAAPGGRVQITDAIGFVRIAALRDLIPEMAAASLDGTLDLDIDHMLLVPAADGSDARIGLWPSKAQGRLRLVDVRVPLIGEAPIGNFELLVRDDTESDDILVDYRDLSGPLELAGDAKIHPDGTFDRACSARARPGAPARLAQAAPFICDSALF
jgi:general secretion pathway protein N